MEWRLAVGDISDHIDPINACIQQVVDEHMGGVVAFAAEVEQPVPTVSRRQRRADDGKGQRMEMPTTYLAAIWKYPEARRALLDKLLALGGCKPSEALAPMTAAEKAAAMRDLITDKALRQRERELGLPPGSLEP